MRIDLPALFDDPALMLHAYETDHARFVPMTRETYASSMFLDARTVPAAPQVYRVPTGALHAYAAQVSRPRRLGFIHHMAQCGSTLLARALDRGGDSLVLREPLHLRQVAIAQREGVAGWQRLLDLSLTMLGKRFDPAAPIIVKGNVPISLIGEQIADANPRQPTILLHFPFEDYCAAVLRTPNHRQWVESVTSEIGLSSDPAVGDIGGLGTVGTAAALWLVMIRTFDRMIRANPEVRSLDANRLFEDPAATVFAASEMMGVGMSRQDAAAMADGPLFATHAKQPGLAYDRQLRIDRREQAKAALGDELAVARRWVEARAAGIGLPAALGAPLLGGPTALL